MVHRPLDEAPEAWVEATGRLQQRDQCHMLETRQYLLQAKNGKIEELLWASGVRWTQTGGQLSDK